MSKDKVRGKRQWLWIFASGGAIAAPGEIAGVIIRNIINGERSPAKLATCRDIRCKESEGTIMGALTGNYRDEHVFALKQALELYDFYETRISECDVQIERAMAKLNQNKKYPDVPMSRPRKRNRQRHEPDSP